MRKVREILRLRFDARLSVRQIAKSCSVSRNTVRDVLERAKSAEVPWPLPDDVDEAELEARMYPPSDPTPSRRRPDMGYIHSELKRKGVTMKLLWEEYRVNHPDGLAYSQFCKLYKEWCGKLDIPMRQVHRAGEKMFVDWVGQTVEVVDEETGKPRPAFIFVAVLGASNCTYAEASLSQDLKAWIGAHVRAFAFFGGVTEILVSDNLATGVARACRYEPDINPAYQDMAEHYGTAVIPTRVRKPRDKAKVENAVRLVEERILAPVRNLTFHSLFELNTALGERLEDFNNRPFQKLEGSRRSLFESIDRPALKPLPQERYEFAEWKKARVNIDHHVEFESSYYSVPYQLVKEQVELRVTDTTVEVLFKGNRVASHRRSARAHSYTTDTNHAPASHRKHAEWTPSKIIKWAGSIGPATAELARQILESRPHPEQGYRACLGIIRLGKRYPADRVEAAARRALSCGATTYKSVKSILENGLDQLCIEETDDQALPEHNNLRGSSYYAGRGGRPC